MALEAIELDSDITLSVSLDCVSGMCCSITLTSTITSTESILLASTITLAVDLESEVDDA
jgi:hypothetical protein